METASIFLIASLAFAVAFGALASCVILKKVLEGRRSQLVAGRAGGIGLFARTVGRGVGPLKGPSRALLRMGFVSSWTSRLVDEVRYLDLETDLESMMSVLLSGSICLGFCVFAVSASLVGALAVVACIFFGLNAWMVRSRDRRRAELREGIPEALQSMKACFQTGYSLSQTVHEVAKSTKGPLSTLFSEVEGSLESNSGAGRALTVLKERGNEPELVFLATALEIQHRTGGSMSRILEATRQSVADELELKRTLKTQTAQAKLSAQIVTAMPFVLIGLFSLLSPGFLDPFFEGPIGLALLALALGMQVLGISLVRRLLKVGVL